MLHMSNVFLKKTHTWYKKGKKIKIYKKGNSLVEVVEINDESLLEAEDVKITDISTYLK